MNTTIRVENVVKRFKNTKAVENLSFDLCQGEILGIVGPNGAGKTTLINLLSGIFKQDSGDIYYNNTRFIHTNIILKKRIGILPEKLGLFEQLSGEEYLFFISRLYGLSEDNTRKHMDELFQFMEMEDDKTKSIHQYSAGMKKKIAISALLIHAPEIVIMDEPFENIDPISVKNIHGVLKKLAQRGSIIIITSQILQSLEKLCSDILIIDHGKNVLFEKMSNIRSHMKESIKTGQNSSLEQLFFDIMKTRDREKSLSWI